VAQPPPTQQHPGRQIAVLGVLFLVVFAAAFLGGEGTWSERLQPRLGLDLVGGTRVTYIASAPDRQAPSAESLEQARQIIANRVNARGVEEAEVVAEGDRNIVISLAGEGDDDLRSVGEPAELRFRKVLKGVTDIGFDPNATPAPTATPDPAATPDPSATPEPEEEAEADAAATATPAAEPSPQAEPAPQATATPAAPDAGGADNLTPEERLAAVQEKVGAEAWQAALELTDPVDLSADPDRAELLGQFGELSALEVAVLPPAIQFNISAITCEQLNARPAGSIRNEGEVVVACEGAGKYLLDAATVLGTHVADANAGIDQTTGRWVVNLDFNGEGREAWQQLTQESVSNANATAFDPAQLGEAGVYGGTRPVQCAENTLGDEGNCRVAVVLDNEIVSAPQIIQVLTGQSTISGDFTQAEAQLLASQLRYGALPLTFETGDSQTITATLGTEYLRAGLLAAGIGMLLVMIYGFFYYRLLGTVIFGSLVLSALLVFGALVVLGRQIGFTLTLAGIAGLIVALGVAADSFVIYFERLKDEIREGRTPRSAVPRAWVRARRTIISANVVSLLAAVVLYIVSAGPVRGFAFALGLATVLDLVVVFLFRHPMMTLLARTKAFLSPRVSGLGRVLERPEDKPVPAGARVKEA
jgi:preprotein translocase subunit SecD